MKKVTTAHVRARYVALTSQLMENQDAYAARKALVRREYGDSSIRTDVILTDLSSSAKTLSAMISALTSVLQAELAWVEHSRAVSHSVTLEDHVRSQPR